MLLNLLYYKHNPLITTVVDGSIFKKIFKTCNLREKLRRYYFYVGDVIIKTKIHFYRDDFLKNYFASKMILLNILQNVAIYLNVLF